MLHATRVVLLGSLALAVSSLTFGCTDVAGGSDVLSELPGEIRSRSFGSTTGAATVPTVEISSPKNFAGYQLTGADTCMNVEVLYTTSVDTEVAAGTYKVMVYDNGVAVGNTSGYTSVGPVTLCLPYGDHLVTIQLVDAAGQPLANAQSRVGVRVRVTKNCVKNSTLCNDDFYCSTNNCVYAGDSKYICLYGAPPTANCCQHDFECAFGQFCDVVGHQCVACLTNTHCDDGNSCTTDTCNAGACQNVKTDPTCCDCAVQTRVGQSIPEQCNDGKICSVEGCDCSAKKCTYSPVVYAQGKCCETDSHISCDDGDACNVDRCVANTCVHGPPVSSTGTCCNDDAGCNDGNVCTTDSCNLSNNQCVFSPVNDPLCCTSSANCNDNDGTTLDACVNFQCQFTTDPSICGVPPDYKRPTYIKDVTITEIMVNPTYASETTGEWVELYNRTDVAIDINGWTLTDASGTQTVTIGSGSAVLVPPRGYAVLCRESDTAQNGGVTCVWEYGTNFTLANSNNDEAVLKDKLGTTVVEVVIDANFPDTSIGGGSIALFNNDEDWGIGANWKLSTLAISATNTDKGTPGKANTDVFQYVDSPLCDDQNVCNYDVCDKSLEYPKCVAAASRPKKANCCTSVADCVKPSVCSQAACVSNQCVFSLVAPPDCCEQDSQCDDGVFCNIDKCVATICRHGPLVGGQGICCDTNADCGAVDNVCVIADCDVAAHQCKPPVIASTNPNCCTTLTYPNVAAPGQCDDGNPATVDKCRDYACVHEPNDNYCDAQVGQPGINNCGLDNDPCTDTACNVVTKTCLKNPVAGCCTAATAATTCNDSNPCTTDTCTAENKCANSGDPACCTGAQVTAGTACNDSNPCTADYCNIYGQNEGVDIGLCRNYKIDPSCCTTAADCNDKNACTNDSCGADNKCVYAPKVLPAGQTCCDAAIPVSMGVQCNDNNDCTAESCVDNLCVHTLQAASEFGTCCDLENVTAGTEAFQCDDKNPCTLDKCIFGRCKSFDDGSATCCNSNADCPDDGNACTEQLCNIVPGQAGVCEVKTGSQCVVKLPWTETWAGPAASVDGIAVTGWEKWQCPPFPDTDFISSIDAQSNWRLSVVAEFLGIDDYMRFHPSARKTDYCGCFLSPIITSDPADHPQKLSYEMPRPPAFAKNFLTVQFESSYTMISPDARMYAFAYETSLGNTYPPVDFDTVIANGWKVHPFLNGSVQPASWKVRTEELDLSDSVHYGKKTTRLAFCIAGDDTFNLEQFSIDNVKMDHGATPT